MSAASLGEAITARVAAVLLGTTALRPTDAAERVYRARAQAVTRAETPIIVVRPSRNSKTPQGDTADLNDLELAVEIYVRGDPFDALADGVAVQIHRALMGDTDLYLLIEDIRHVSDDWLDDEADETAGSRIMTYRFTFLSDASDLTRAPRS